ncbi:TcpE family conjugal transfer membrane protein [Staphylococcus aureus]|uniref:TcpE family conjugal transfer membrane protein n=1 Tax=Staphylococcus aureus TaxID=1280 RepID=UPI0029C00F67|nr:TcpE family conjugal transfer membrane protein [Staphylococcus aureus]WPF96936.1 TcpE family conjugal transfer membrane protein [Staphylococcus aureus]WPF98898.1 TcpE family conjugal transfer membrane protein [Staphylococcus aureus]
MHKKAYNLKRTFEQPIVMYEFTQNSSWSKGVRLDWVGTLAVLELILIIAYFKLGMNIITGLIPGLTIIYFTVFPYYLTKQIVKLKQDGKKLLFFLWDFILYVFNIQMRNVNYAYDEEVKYLNKKSIKLK